MPYTEIETHNKNNDFNNIFRRKELNDLEQSINWDDLVEAIYPHYVKSKISPTSLTVENILRIYILGRHFDMSPSGIKKALLKTDTLRDFALIDLDRDEIPTESHITDFVSLLMEQSLAMKIQKALKIKPKAPEYVAAF